MLGGTHRGIRCGRLRLKSAGRRPPHRGAEPALGRRDAPAGVRHPLAEPAPRDIVAREIYREIQNQKSPYVRLDITSKPKDFLMKRFPTIYNTCLEHGIDMSKEFIPVGPVQHFMMGGTTHTRVPE